MRLARVLVSSLMLALPAAASGAQSQTRPQTGAEAESWERSTSYTEVLSFLSEVQARTDLMLVRRIGSTEEGRDIPAVFLGNPPVANPAALSRSEKPSLLITGSIHGDEPAGREAALQLVRELALGDDQRFLDRVNVIVVPYMNPDGGEAGTRENARGYDLNRDWVTAETPEVSAVLEGIVTRYWPDVFLDVHNGGSLPYHLTFQTSLEPAADSDLVAFARGPVFDWVHGRLESENMDMFWYSGPSYDDRQERWYWRTTQPFPRKQHSYAGLQDMIALLFEVPEAHAPNVGAAAAREGMRGLVEFLAENSQEVRSRVRDARQRTLDAPLSEVYIGLVAEAYEESERFFVVPPPENGAPARAQVVEGENRTLYVPTEARPAPWGYAFDGELEDLALLLGTHGVQVERLDRPVTVPIERYVVRQIIRERDRYHHHLRTEVRVDVEPAFETLPAGMLMVSVRQPAGRLIPQLLEPDAVDSVVRWNFLDTHLPTPGPESYLPLYRLDARPGVSTVLVR